PPKPQIDPKIQKKEIGNNQKLTSPHGKRHSKPKQIFPKQMLKTDLCKFYNQQAGCKYGIYCRFAHGEHELKTPIIQKPPTFPPPTIPKSKEIQQTELKTQSLCSICFRNQSDIILKP